MRLASLWWFAWSTQRTKIIWLSEKPYKNITQHIQVVCLFYREINDEQRLVVKYQEKLQKQDETFDILHTRIFTSERAIGYGKWY
jgi:hypothetical protein